MSSGVGSALGALGARATISFDSRTFACLLAPLDRRGCIPAGTLALHPMRSVVPMRRRESQRINETRVASSRAAPAHAPRPRTKHDQNRRLPPRSRAPISVRCAASPSVAGGTYARGEGNPREDCRSLRPFLSAVRIAAALNEIRSYLSVVTMNSSNSPRAFAAAPRSSRRLHLSLARSRLFLHRRAPHDRASLDDRPIPRWTVRISLSLPPFALGTSSVRRRRLFCDTSL